MNRRRFLSFSLAAMVNAAAARISPPMPRFSGHPGPDYTNPAIGLEKRRLHIFRYENVLGTSLELKFLTESEAQAKDAKIRALAEIRRSAKTLSSWDANSEASRWASTRGVPVPVSPELFEVLALYDSWRQRTSGAVEASVQQAIEVWRTAVKQQRAPVQADLDYAVEQMRQKHWNLDADHRTATRLSDTCLVFASFTKSYILNRAIEAAMKTEGVSAAVVNIGGDLVVRGTLAEQVHVADPFADGENNEPMAKVVVSNRAIATSGDYRRGFQIDGTRYSHIIDPRTAIPATEVISSTVISSDAVQAGALATAFSVLKPDESQQLARSFPAIDYLIVTRQGHRLASGEFAGIAQATPRPVVFQAGGGGSWDPAMELTIRVEIASPRGFAKRPYLAAWVEDSNRVAVRTIALWYRKERFLDELRRWYRAQGSESLPSVSSATRGPGQYTISWDGRDNAGRYIKAGRYTVYLEVAREHGTYQLMHQEFDFNGSPKQVSFPANTEISSASFDYHRRSGGSAA